MSAGTTPCRAYAIEHGQQAAWDLFYPEAGGKGTVAASRAKELCAACPRRSECLAEADAVEAMDGQASLSTHGVWGGLTASERTDRRRQAVVERRHMADRRWAEIRTNGWATRSQSA